MIGYYPNLDEMRKERRRWNSLTKAEQDAEIKKNLEKYKERERVRLEELRKENEKKQKKFREEAAHMDHPNTMDDGTATFFWIAIMIVAALFRDRLIIWIFATIVYIMHLTRHERDLNNKEENK